MAGERKEHKCTKRPTQSVLLGAHLDFSLVPASFRMLVSASSGQEGGTHKKGGILLGGQ